ncbi:hypothetical protein [Kribbella sp. DT2]|uniref:hypothetical protein n=1 Tax=Kribbella sp. DT2 TaxID=3393427 RepID=UPI003CE806E5
MIPRTFELVRHRDLSGVSGTGVVAEGCVFTDGSVALRWRGNNPATAVWPDLDSVLAVHGHHGATEVHWLESWTEPSTPLDPPQLETRPPLGKRGARPLQDFHNAPPPAYPSSLDELDGSTPSQGITDRPDGRGERRAGTEAARSPLDGPTVLPRLAGLDYPAPLDYPDPLDDGTASGDGSAPGEFDGTDADDRAALDELFGVQHAVRPPGGPVDPLQGGHVRGWSGARHLR